MEQHPEQIMTPETHKIQTEPPQFWVELLNIIKM
jgi:hypothetical protein